MTTKLWSFRQLESKMISLEKCRELLDPKKEKYTDEELLQIKDWLVKLAHLNVQLFQEHQRKLKTKSNEESSNNVSS